MVEFFVILAAMAVAIAVIQHKVNRERREMELRRALRGYAERMKKAGRHDE